MPTEQTFFNTPNLPKKIGSTKVKKKTDMLQLMNDVSASISIESGNSKGSNFIQSQLVPQITYAQAPEPHAPLYPVLFKQMREIAQQNKAPNTDQAILEAAAWYYYNIEEPKSPSSSIAQYGTDENNPIVKDQKKKKDKSKIIKYGMIGGSILVGLSLLYFAFKPQGAKSNPSPRPKRRKKPKFVTKGRVRKRNRKKPVKSKSKPKIAYTSSGGNLQAYRNNFEKRKRKNKVK